MQNKTQEALAAALECDQKYISRIENGQAKPNLAICLRLANFFHVTLDFLLEGACEVQCSPKDRERLCSRKMLEEIGKQLNFTTLHYHRLDDLTASIGLSPCKMCTYCFNHQG